MSELIVIGFREPHRSLEVMSELWRLSEGLMTDLEEAVVLSWNAQGKLTVRQSVNLSTGEGVRWGRFWGAFIRSTLLCVQTDQMTAAAKALAGVAGALSDEASETASEMDVKWWEEEIGLPTVFLRDVGAMIQPGDSAIFALLQHSDPLLLIRTMPNYGGTLLHTALDARQKAKVMAFLAGSQPLNPVARRE
jgi:uncharacterized membrane protein